LFGWTREEAVGRKVHEILKSQFLESPENIQEELLRTGQWQGEILTHQKNGSLLNIATHWILYRDPNGAPIGIAEVYNDVTDLRRAEAAVREADRRKQEFLATLAHELRNPLAPVSNSLQIMRLSDELSPSMQRLREIMEQQVGHIVRLVDDLLDVSRVTCGKIMLKRERILLAELVANAVEMVRRQVEESQLELSVSLPTEPLFLDVDPIRIAQVVSNLLGNAVKYTEPGGHIWLSAIHHDNELTLTVRDTGAGIPPDMLEHIFQMFNQIDRTLTRSSGGLGIGLTLAKSLVELHGGSITAESTGPGQGSLFTIRLPIQSNIERNEQRPRIESDPTRQIPKSRRVLVVDDMHSVGYVLGRLLEKLGQSVELARGGHEALQAIAKQRPDVVFSDIAMPHMDGYELARQIRRDPKLRGVVLVALTGFGQAADRERAFAAGFDHHLVKPAGMEALRQILSQTDRVGEKSVDVCHDMTIERGSH
jgi:PAS domain S-box-containing protein